MIELTRRAVLATALLLAACAHQRAASPPAAENAAPAPVVDAPAGIAPQLTQALATAAAEFPGVAFAVITPEGSLWQGGAGYADIEAGEAMTAQTQVSVYSVSKPMTATLAVGLAESSQLDLDRAVGDVAATPEALRTFTPRELLTHTSGIRHYRDGEWLRVSRSPCAAPGEALAPFAADAPGPRGVNSYSSYGYVLLSHALEGASGRPFTALMHDRVFTASGMANSLLWTPGLRRPPHGYEEARGGFRPARVIDNSCKFGAGGVISTAEDLARFGAALRSGRLVSAASWTSMTEGAQNDYGLGWGVGALPDGASIAAHSGSGIGGTSAIVIDLRDGFVVALAGNVDGPSLVDDARAILTLARASRP